MTDLQFEVTQNGATEPPFQNQYWDNKKEGIYLDIVTKEPLFCSLDKYDSGSGWPSFFRAIDDQLFITRNDYRLMQARVELLSQKGETHLGHLFDDGPEPTGKRYCINSASLEFVPLDDMEQRGYGEYLELFYQQAIFAAGCFWGVQEIFRKIEGVVSSVVGYIGGELENPEYEDVCSGDTGHAEAILITFTPQKVSYEKLLNYFWRLHDPTTLDRQGADVGSQYRSAVFYTSEEQRKIAERSKQDFDASGVFENKAVTEISAASTFYSAEEYHQEYYQKNPGWVCHRLREK